MWNGPWGWGLGVEVAVDRGSGDAELGGDFGDGVEVTALLVGLVVHLPGRPGLAGAELWFLAAGTAAGPGGGESVSGAFGHEGVFELGDRAEDLEEHPTYRGGGVDALVEDDQVNAAGVQVVGQVDEVFQRSAEPVELGDDELVAAAASDGQCSFKFGPAGQFPGGVVDEDLFAAGRGERIVLRFGVLIAGGRPARNRFACRKCNANPRQRDIGVYTGCFTTTTCGNGRGSDV